MSRRRSSVKSMALIITMLMWQASWQGGNTLLATPLLAPRAPVPEFTYIREFLKNRYLLPTSHWPKSSAFNVQLLDHAVFLLLKGSKIDDHETNSLTLQL